MGNAQTSIDESNRMAFGMTERPESVLLVLDHSGIFDEIDDYLRGRYYDQSSKIWIKIDKPKMNATGVAETMLEIRFRVSKVFSLSNFKNDEISSLMRVFWRQLVKFLYIRRRVFGIDREDIPLVAHKIGDAVFSVLKMSQSDNMKKFLGKNFQSREVVTSGKGNTGGLFK